MRKSRDTLPKRSIQPSTQQQPPPRHSYLHKLGDPPRLRSQAQFWELHCLICAQVEQMVCAHGTDGIGGIGNSCS